MSLLGGVDIPPIPEVPPIPSVDVSSLISDTGLCGASAGFDGLLSKLKTIEADLLANIDLDASALKAKFEVDLLDLETDLRALIPKLDLELPTISLQKEFKQLLAMSPASGDYLSKLTEINSTFGSALSKAGQDLNSLLTSSISGLGGGVDLCSQIPNFESKGKEVLEKAQNSLQAQIPAIKEELSKINDEEIATKITDMKEQLETDGNSAMAFWTSPASVKDAFSDPSDDSLPTSAGNFSDGGELEISSGDNLSRGLL
tara:strand:+ start:2204 stop:2980 length:777 start_codon:yes stop_codon:yes gene_type:complete